MKYKLQLLSAIILLGLVFSTNLFGQTTKAKPTGAGTESTPYQIASLANLSWLIQNSGEWDKFYLQTIDIDATETQYWDDDDGDGDGDLFNDTNDGTSTGNNEGFSPIGNYSTNFTGNYNGNGFVIDGLTILRVSDPFYGAGLFGNIDGATINNLGVTNVNISEGYVESYASALVGAVSTSTISNCYTSGTINGTRFVGGVAGVCGSSTVSNCYSTCTINGTADYLGGFVGRSYTSTISNCYSRGNVNKASGDSDNIGGFAGSVISSNITEYCYSTGMVTNGDGNPTDKGFVGTNDYCTYTSNFFDMQTSLQTSDAAGTATGKTTAEMKTKSTFTDASWDFSGESANGTDEIWDIDGSKNDGYPFFTGTTPVPVELTNFTAQAVAETIVLNWQTATEVNNYGFEIERSVVSNQTSETNWETIGFAEGHGNSNSPKEYTFTDNIGALSLSKCQYRLKQIDFDGAFEYSDVVEVTLTNSLEYKLTQNHPNPFNPTTQIAFTIPSAGIVRLNIYNVLGEIVSELVNENLEAGSHQYQFNATNLTSGIYFYSISVNGFTEVKKMNLIK